MRSVLGVFVSLVMFAALFANRAEVVRSAPPFKLIHLTNDPAVERNPSISWSSNGDVTVAWEQDIYPNGVLQLGVFARVQHAGNFGPAFNLSATTGSSQEPSAFSAGAFASVLYLNALTGSRYMARSDWSGAAWSVPQRVAGGDYVDSRNPVAVQASDGSTWLARWVRTVGNHSDIIVQQIGGPGFNVSHDGRAWRHPALVAGNGGEVYVAWIDHTSGPHGAAPGVRLARVTSGGVVALRQASTDYYAYWPALAFHAGQLYVVWVATFTGLVHERVLTGSIWGPDLTIAPGDTPRVAVTSGGNVYVAWEHQGQISLQENSNAPQRASGLAPASEPALTVDGSENALVTFIAYDNVWYAQIPSQ